MGERMEVEAVCGWQPCGRCSYPASDSFWMTCPVVEGSLTEARLRLADAAEAYFRAQGDERGEWDVMVQASFDLALLRTKRAGG